jgi:hypothetical protein
MIEYYLKKNWVYIYSGFDPEMIDYVRKLRAPYYAFSTTREWSFDEKDLEMFKTLYNPTLIDKDVITTTENDIIYVRFIDFKFDVEELNNKIPGYKYDADDHVFVVPLSSKKELNKYLRDNNLSVHPRVRFSMPKVVKADKELNKLKVKNV